MATPEALIKYYDCLKDSFNKIQLKDNKTALVNAALRPKIRDELGKSKNLLVSYLNYIQVFTLIYSEKFTNICLSIICPLFKENHYSNSNSNSNGVDQVENKDVAQLIHNTIREILKSKPELVDEFTHCLVKFFPNTYSDGHDVFINYLSNSLQTCGYVRGEPLTNLVARILDRLNPPAANLKSHEENAEGIRQLIGESYELIYKQLDVLDKRQKDNFSAAMLAAFTREFLTSENEDELNYLVLYICSLDDKLLDLFINLLWATFTNIDRPFEERRASVCFACSFMSRANYVGLEKVLNYLETSTSWCTDFLTEYNETAATTTTTTSAPTHEVSIRNENIELFYALFHSMLYLITQRYREMYEVDSIERLKMLNLDQFLNSSAKPLEICDIETEQRFREVATLYDISILKPVNDKLLTPVRKKRKSINDLGGGGGASNVKRPIWRVPFKDTNHSLPDHIRPLYRNYYDHRNFTVYRE